MEQTSDSSPRYGGPMTQQIARAVCGGGIVLGILTAALAVSAIGLQRSNEALAQANANAEAIASGRIGTIQDSAQLDAIGVPASAPISLKPTFKPTTSEPTAKPTEAPTSKPTGKPTDAPTEPHPLNPQWFQTTHADYQLFLDNKENNAPNGGHDYIGANILCGQQKMFVCDYDSYCPNGQGAAPFQGGPPKLHNHNTLEETQWSPFSGPAKSDPAPSHWIQIGHLSAEEGGSEENNFIQCWKYYDWYAGNGVDIVDVWEAEHRMWILCCERAQEDEGEGGTL